MPDATDIAATISVRLISDISAQLARDGAAFEAFNAKVAAAPVNIGSVGAMRAIEAENGKLTASSVEMAARREAVMQAAYAKETAAAIKSGDVQIAKSQAVTLALIRDADRQTAAAKAAADKRAATLTGTIGGATLVGGLALGGSIAAAAQYDDTLIKIRGNTSSTTAQIKEMDDAIRKMAASSPASINDIAAAFERAANLGIRGADAVKLVQSSMEAALATGGSVEDMLNLTGTAMRNWHQSATQAQADVNIFVKAAADSNVRLPDMANNFQKVGVMASAMHIPLADAAAAYATIAGSTHDAALAQTLMIGVMNKIMNPTSTIIKLMDQLKQSSGVDLVKAFGETAAGTMRLSDLMGLAAKATDGNAASLYKLFGGIRGGQGAVILALEQWQKYNQTLKDTHKTHDDVGTSYQLMVGSVSGQTKILENNLNLLAISLGQTLTPTFIGLAGDITPVVKGIKDLNDETHGAVAKAAEYGVAAGALILALLKVKNAFGAIETAAKSARVAEIAAFAASPAGIAVAITAFASYEAHQKTVNDNLDAMKSAEARLTTEYDKGNISADQARKILAAFAAVAKVGTGDVVDLTMAKLNDSKVKYQDHIKLEADALHHLGTELTDSVGYWHAATAAKKGYYQFDGKGAAALSPGGADPGKSGTFNIQTEMTHAKAMIDNWATKVVADEHEFGKHSAEVAWATQMLHKWQGTSAGLDKQWQDLTGTTVKLKTAGLDPFTKGFQDAQKRLSDATAVIANDYVKGLPVTAAQRKAFDDATASVKRYQAAQDAADGTTAAREKARQDKADAAQKAAWARIDKGLDAQAVKDHNLEVAADKAAQALLGVQRAAIERSPVYQASVARYNATVTPAQQTGGLDPITIIENKIANLWNTSESEADYERSYGILSAQLAAAIKKYGDGVQKQFDKAEKDLENNPNIPGTDAWVKAMEALWKKVAASPEVVAGLANLGKAGGLATGGTFGGQNAAAGNAATAFQNQVNLGVLGAANSAQSQQVALQVAKQIGDVGTQFSILSGLYKDGKISLAALIPVERENAALLTQQNQRLMINDIAMGDLAGAAGIAKQAYLDGTMSLDQYVKIQQAANTVDAQQADLQAKADIALGDFAGAAAIAKTAFDNGSMSMDTYVPILQQANAGTAAMASRTLEAAYAAGTLAEKSQMVVSAMSAIVSRASTIASAQSGVDQANIAVIAAQSAVAVGYLQAQVTATQDLAGIVSASSAVQTAVFQGQLAAINDGTTIMQDLYGIQSATSPEAVQVARDQLAVDQMIARMNQANAAAQIRVTSDTAKMAMDKLGVDNANSNANSVVAALHLKVSQDAVKIALDNQKLALDQLVTLQDIDANLGGDPQASLILQDMAQLQTDQAKSTADQYAEAYAQAQAAAIAGQGNLLLAGDQGQINSDQANAASISQGFELSIAGLKQQQAADNIKLQESSAKTAANTTQLVEMQQGVKDILDEIRDLNNRGLMGMERNNVSTDSTAALLGRMGSQISANPTP